MIYVIIKKKGGYMRNNFISKVFQWLALGLIITFGVGYALTLNEEAMTLVVNNYFLVIILELISGFGLSIFINKMSNTTAKILYLLYAALTGVTFMTIFLMFEVNSIIWVFVATAIIFGIFGLIGKKIKINLSGFGSFLLFALLGMIVLSIVNIFILNEALDMTIALVSLLIFVGYIVFDINHIIKMSEMNLEEKYAIFGAFQLYLDIINIIVELLRLFGRERD